MRATINRETIVTARFDDDGGLLVDCGTPPMVTVYDGAGVVITSGTATKVASTTGTYQFVIPARTRVDELRVEFAGVVNSLARIVTRRVSIVEKRLVPLWRLRQIEELEPLSTENIQRCADAVEDWFNSALGFPYCEESKRLTWRYQGGARLTVPGVMFPKQLFGLTTNTVAYAAGELGQIVVTRNSWEYLAGSSVDFLVGTGATVFRTGGTTTVDCSHGPNWVRQPEDLTRAATIFATYIARGSGYPERASQIATEGALITFSVPSPFKPTGLPEVDAVVGHYGIPTVI